MEAARRLFPASDPATAERLQPLWDSVAAATVAEITQAERHRAAVVARLAEMGFVRGETPPPPPEARAEIARRQAEAVAP